MAEPKIKTLNGFEYYSVNHWGYWSWNFRPKGGPIFSSAPGPKAKFLALLSSPREAIAFYKKRLAQATDVVAATNNLARARAFHAHVTAPDWDPGGNTNNPGKVARALREAAISKDRVLWAERELAAAIALRDKLLTEPYDLSEWERIWLPCGATTPRAD